MAENETIRLTGAEGEWGSNIGTLYVWSIYGDYEDNYRDLLPHSPFSTSKSLKFAGGAAPPLCHSTMTGHRDLGRRT